MTKVCKDCGKRKPLTEFHVYSGQMQPRCRPCQREFKRRYKDGQRVRPQVDGEVTSGPFLSWLREYVQQWPSFGEACRMLETPERVVWRWLNRPGPFIAEVRIDRVFCAAGMPHLLRELYWAELYAHLDEEEDMAA